MWMNQWSQPVIFPNESERLTLVAAYKSVLAAGDLAAIAHMAAQPNRYIESSAFAEIGQRLRAYFDAPDLEVILTGSASLGFSPIAKPEFGKTAWRGFSDQSDVDLALIHAETFDRYWLAAYRHRLRTSPWPNLKPMQSYFFAGWFRPDLAPTTFALRNNWFDFFRRISSDVLEFPISAGLYRSREFLDEHRWKTCRAARQL